MENRVRRNVAVIGCGNILERYLTGMARFPRLNVVGCADIDKSRSEAASRTYGLRAYETIADLLGDPSVEVVVNITPPAAHGSVTTAALTAGKHVYVEKPLAATLGEADRVLEVLKSTGRRLGCAPDTFLGSAAQTARRAIDDGAIGDVIGVACFVTHTLAETWHPDPTLFFRPGGGPLLDMGPYSIASMVNCLGPITEVSGATRIGASPRVVTAPDRLVETIDVQVATHAAAVLRFASGVLGSVMMSFDIWNDELPFIEIYGTKGILRLADPNGFDGDVSLRLNSEASWQVLDPVIPLLGEPDSRDQLLRGMGVADLVLSLDGRPQRTSPSLAYHVLEVLESVEASSASHSVLRLKSSCDRPAPITTADVNLLLESVA